MFGKHSSISSKPRLQACAPKLQEHGTNSIHKTVIHQPIKQKTTFTPTIKQPISSIPLSSHRREKSIKPSLSHRNGRSMLSPSERSISTNFSSSIFRPSSVSTQPQISQQSTTKTSTSPLGPAVTIPIRTDWQNVYLRKRRRRRRRRKRRRAVRPAQLYRRPPTEDEEFMEEVGQKYGTRGQRQASAILEEARQLFAGGELSDEDQLAFLTEMQQLFLEAKQRAKKFTPKRYLHEDGDQ